jgi:lysyl-tRNA synthetase, class II
VRSVALLRERGVRQVSLNFAAFGRYLREPQGPLEQALAHVLGVADRWFQIERLYRFNAKFAPQWQPRYLIYQSTSSLPRSALAVLWLEGQAPKPTPPWRWSAQRRPRTSAHAR